MKEQHAFIPANLEPWIDARRRFRLSHAHVQMARELGMNPKKLGKLDNHDQEQWKLPLPQFIGKLYFKRFGKVGPDTVHTIEEIAAAKKAKKERRKARRLSSAGGLAARRSFREITLNADSLLGGDIRIRPFLAVAAIRCLSGTSLCLVGTEGHAVGTLPNDGPFVAIVVSERDVPVLRFEWQ